MAIELPKPTAPLPKRPAQFGALNPQEQEDLYEAVRNQQILLNQVINYLQEQSNGNP